jgi:lipopolysaccharide export system permease protein
MTQLRLTLPSYIIRDAMKPSLLGMGILLGLVWLLQSLRFLDLVINKGLGMGTFLHLTLMLVPRMLTIILPFGMFIGACVMLRRWQEDNELTAALSLGRSPYHILRPLITWALVSVAFGYVLFLHIMPASTAAFKDLQHQIRTQNAQLLLEEGTFNQLGSNLMIYLRTRATPTTLDQILVHDTRNPAKPVTWYAQHGEITLDADGYPQLALQKGLRQEVSEKQVGMLEFEKYNLDIRQSLGQQVTAPRVPGYEEYGLFQLLSEAERAQDPRLANDMRAEFHKRLIFPLTPLPLTLIAAAWLLRPPRRQQSPWRLLVAASLSGFAYLGIMMLLEGLSQDGSPVVLYGQWLWPFVGAGYAAFVAKKGRIHA